MGVVSVLAFGCTHIPHHDKGNAAWIISQIKERQPNVIVCLGDLIECDAVSSYPKVDIKALDEEYDEASEFLEQIYDAAPKAKRIHTEGNHEERIFRADYAKVSGVLDYRKKIKALRRWRSKPYPYVLHPDNTFKLGQLTFYHGWCATIGGASERKEAIDLGVPYGLCVSAHTHRPIYEQVSLNTWKIPYWRANVGCGIDFEWVQGNYCKKRNISQWAHGIVVGWADTKRRHDGRRNWAVELLLKKKAWED